MPLIKNRIRYGIQKAMQDINKFLWQKYRTTNPAEYYGSLADLTWREDPNDEANCYRPLLDWQMVCAREGGVGPKRIKSIKDAIERQPFTITGQWFLSNQVDESFYGRGDYLYNLLFGYALVSLKTYATIGEDLVRRNLHWNVADQGGSIFGAIALLNRGIKKVTVYNLPGVQVEYGKYVLSRLGLDETYVEFDVSGNPPHPVHQVIVCSEYFEHWRNPCAEFDRLIEHNPNTPVYERSSFCLGGYGHFLPLMMGDIKTYTNEDSDRCFLAHVQSKGYNVTDVPGWKSRVHLFEKV